MSLITVIGRGHGGTRAMSHTLTASGVYMGSLLNTSGDLLPPQPMYDACRIIAKHVVWKGGLEWDFSQLHTTPIPDEFSTLINTYLQSVLANKSEHKGWKIPETTLAFPWILRMFPDAHYIFWVRNPRDSILDQHVTDDLNDFGIHYPNIDELTQMIHEQRTQRTQNVSSTTESSAQSVLTNPDELLRVRLRRAISWKYQYDLVKSTPKPEKWIEVRFEDFIMKQPATLRRLERFLGFKLGRIIVRPDAVDRWKKAKGVSYFDFFESAMNEYGYER